MKHPNHVGQDCLRVEYSEIRPLVEKTARQLSEAGISATVTGERDADNFKGFRVYFKFSKPVKGRDWKGSKIDCNGFWIWILNTLGPDSKKDEGGRAVFKDGKQVFEGEPYPQYSASWRFMGTERRFRCRRIEAIQDNTMTVYDYNDAISEIDFQRNVDYLRGVKFGPHALPSRKGEIKGEI